MKIREFTAEIGPCASSVADGVVRLGFVLVCVFAFWVIPNFGTSTFLESFIGSGVVPVSYKGFSLI
jgi:hypothetical protein